MATRVFESHVLACSAEAPLINLTSRHGPLSSTLPSLKAPFCLIDFNPLGEQGRPAHRTGTASLQFIYIHVLFRVKLVRRGAKHEMRGKRAARWFSWLIWKMKKNHAKHVKHEYAS